MMTQPIQMFENLTSETAPVGRKDITKVAFSFEERRLLELRARYARAELMANSLGDALLWVGRRYTRLVAAFKADFKLRAAEAQLLRMTDRELADLGLARGDIPFAVREAAEGIAPQFDTVTGGMIAANQNLHRAA
ncbi:MAG: DUF1127 domain-containing protein [Reyranella sp.]|nr:DUF1127 domain-containing protein [Reyranella sp.]